MRIIDYLLTCDEFMCNEQIILDEIPNMSESLLSHLLKKYKNVFIRIENHIQYKPPFNIKDKTTLAFAIENAYPQGIPVSVLSLCYEFAISDMHQLQYNKKLMLHKYGKTNEKVIFPLPCCNLNNPRLKYLWDNTEQIRVDMSFKKLIDEPEKSNTAKKRKKCMKCVPTQE